MMSLRRSFLKRFNQLRRGRMALVRHEGCSFLLDTRNSLDMKLMGGMNWERGLRDRAVAEIGTNKLDLFIDAGANLGLYTIDLNQRCDLRETIAFEPMPTNFNQLCGNIFMNNMSARVTAKCTALSDTDGTAKLQIDTSHTIHSTLLPSIPNGEGKFDQSLDVPLIRFDAHHPFEGRRVFMKMDVEGHEHAALSGMSSFLTRNKASLQIESGEEFVGEVKSLLASFGYRHTGRQADDHFFSNM